MKSQEMTVRCSSTMMDGRKKTVTEHVKGNDLSNVLMVLQAKYYKWFWFLGCEIEIEFERGKLRCILETDSNGNFCLLME